MTDRALLPCPFCAGEPEYTVSPYQGTYGVRCSACGASSANYSVEGGATEAWNDRLTAALAQPETDAGVEDDTIRSVYRAWTAERVSGENPVGFTAFHAGYRAALRSRSAGASAAVRKPMKMLVDNDWLKEKIAASPDDVECEARSAGATVGVAIDAWDKWRGAALYPDEDYKLFKAGFEAALRSRATVGVAEGWRLVPTRAWEIIKEARRDGWYEDHGGWDELDALLFAAPQAPVPIAVGEEWKPIETAPKDGRYVLLCYRKADSDPGVWPGFYSIRYDQWWVDTDIVIPNHWRPLPPAPTQDEEERSA